MFNQEIIAIAKRLGRIEDIKEIELDCQNHDKFFISKTTLSSALDGAKEPKILFGYNGLVLAQQLLYRSKSLIEGVIHATNQQNISTALVTVRAHYETTGSIAFFLKRLRSYYEGNISFEAIDNYLYRLFAGSKTFDLEEVPEPVQVMDLIDSVDHYIKKYLLRGDSEDKKFRSLYNDLSDYSHPNFHSNCCGSEVNVIEKAVIFHETGTMREIHLPLVLTLSMSSRLFLHFFEETVNLLKQNETMPTIHA